MLKVCSKSRTYRKISSWFAVFMCRRMLRIRYMPVFVYIITNLCTHVIVTHCYFIIQNELVNNRTIRKYYFSFCAVLCIQHRVTSARKVHVLSTCYQTLLVLFLFLEWRRQVSYPHKTPNKIIFVLVFGIFSDNKQEDMCLQTVHPEQQYKLNFRFITVVMNSRQASVVRRCYC
jgi:CDP-diglyceride synthetase